MTLEMILKNREFIFVHLVFESNTPQFTASDGIPITVRSLLK